MELVSPSKTLWMYWTLWNNTILVNVENQNWWSFQTWFAGQIWFWEEFRRHSKTASPIFFSHSLESLESFVDSCLASLGSLESLFDSAASLVVLNWKLSRVGEPWHTVRNLRFINHINHIQSGIFTGSAPKSVEWWRWQNQKVKAKIGKNEVWTEHE